MDEPNQIIKGAIVGSPETLPTTAPGSRKSPSDLSEPGSGPDAAIVIVGVVVAPDTAVYRARYDEMMKVRRQHGLPNNSALTADGFLALPGVETLGPVPRQLLYACYKRFAPNAELGRFSEQPAAGIRILRDAGYIFGVGRSLDPAELRPADRRSGGQALVVCEGQNYRYIIRHDPSEVLGGQCTVHGSGTKLFKQGAFCAHTGTTSVLEIDHRQPVGAHRRLGTTPPTELTKEMVENGEAGRHYQILSRNANQRKREVCGQCLAGKEIVLPPPLRRFKDHYRREFSDSRVPLPTVENPAVACRGCFYFDHSTPLFPLPEATLRVVASQLAPPVGLPAET
jgi:hypothetical protein